jgi:hypothetical protein
MVRDSDAVFGEWAGTMMVTLGTVNLVVAMLLVVMFFLSIRDGSLRPSTSCTRLQFLRVGSPSRASARRSRASAGSASPSNG